MVELVVFGAPGSGKTTLAHGLVSTFNLSYIGTGELSRQLAASDPCLQAQLATGVWAPEAPLRSAVHQAIRTADQGFVLDGFPRRAEQAQLLDQWVPDRPWAIYLTTDETLARQRVLARGRVDQAGYQLWEQHWYVETQPLIKEWAAAKRLFCVDGSDRNQALAETICWLNRVMAEEP